MMGIKQLTFEDYDGFVEKFKTKGKTKGKTKMTTDECYTPPKIYEAVLDWAVDRYGIDREKVVRPFYPGGDYETFDYFDGAVVVDNPPFSIEAKIIDFYLTRQIPFFLFGNALTLFEGGAMGRDVGFVFTNSRIEYENGAKVLTGFITSLGENRIETAPDLRDKINAIQKAAHVTKDARANTTSKNKYRYPDNIVTAGGMDVLSRSCGRLEIKKSDCMYITKLATMDGGEVDIFGSAYALNDKATEAKLAAERECGVRGDVIPLQLTERDRLAIPYIGK